MTYQTGILFKRSFKLTLPDLDVPIVTGDEAGALQLLNAHPELKNYRDFGGTSAFRLACQFNRVEVCKLLASLGAPLDIDDPNQDSLLCHSIAQGRMELVRLLFELGANPNFGRTLFAAVNCGGSKGLESLRLLLEHGVEVNRVFAIFGDRSNVRSPLDFCSGEPEFVELLLAAGAKTSAELLKSNPNLPIEDADQ